MRTTVELADDTAAALAALRRDEGLGVSEAINELIRRGLAPRPSPTPFRQGTRSAGLKVDVTNVADALDVIEGSDAR